MELSDIGNRAFCGCEQLQRFTWIGVTLNSGCRQSTMLSLCVTNLKNPCVLLPAEGPDSDTFDEELHPEYSKYHASP